MCIYVVELIQGSLASRGKDGTIQVASGRPVTSHTLVLSGTWETDRVKWTRMKLTRPPPSFRSSSSNQVTLQSQHVEKAPGALGRQCPAPAAAPPPGCLCGAV